MMSGQLSFALGQNTFQPLFLDVLVDSYLCGQLPLPYDTNIKMTFLY